MIMMTDSVPEKVVQNEFNLSEKIGQWGYNDDGTPDSDVIEADDVKEFIRLEGILIRDFISGIIDSVEFWNKRSELAGEDLT